EDEVACGGVEGESGFCVPKGFPTGIRVSLRDAFETAIFDVTKPVSLGTPANRDGAGIDEPATHLKGYQIKLTTVPRQPGHQKRGNLRIRNAFHPEGSELVVETVKPDRLLIPTAESLVQPVAAPDRAAHGVDDYECYVVKTLGFGAGTNLYAYVENDPVNLKDPRGTNIPTNAGPSGDLISKIIEHVFPGIKHPADTRQPKPGASPVPEPAFDPEDPPKPVIAPRPLLPQWIPGEEPTQPIRLPPIPPPERTPVKPEQGALALFLMCLMVAGALAGG